MCVICDGTNAAALATASLVVKYGSIPMSLKPIPAHSGFDLRIPGGSSIVPQKPVKSRQVNWIENVDAGLICEH